MEIKKTALAKAISLTIFAFPAFALAIDVGALPDTANALVKYGNANMNQVGNALNIDASGSAGLNGNTLIEWGGAGFNVGSGAEVNFDAKQANSIILNHDVSGALSVIDGSINSSQGHIVIVNQNGIHHGGSGNAALTLIQGVKSGSSEFFGLDNGDRVFIEYDLPQPEPYSPPVPPPAMNVVSNLGQMTRPDSASALKIAVAGGAAIHTNEQSVEISHNEDSMISDHQTQIIDSVFMGTDVFLQENNIVDQTDFYEINRSDLSGSLTAKNVFGVAIVNSNVNKLNADVHVLANDSSTFQDMTAKTAMLFNSSFSTYYGSTDIDVGASSFGIFGDLFAGLSASDLGSLRFVKSSGQHEPVLNFDESADPYTQYFQLEGFSDTQFSNLSNVYIKFHVFSDTYNGEPLGERNQLSLLNFSNVNGTTIDYASNIMPLEIYELRYDAGLWDGLDRPMLSIINNS